MAKCQIASWSGFANGSTGQAVVGGGVMLSLPFASCLLAFCLCLYSCSEAPPEAFPPISHKHGSPKERRLGQGCEAPVGLDLDQAAAFGNVLGCDGLGGARECPTASPFTLPVVLHRLSDIVHHTIRKSTDSPLGVTGTIST